MRGSDFGSSIIDGEEISLGATSLDGRTAEERAMALHRDDSHAPLALVGCGPLLVAERKL